MLAPYRPSGLGLQHPFTRATFIVSGVRPFEKSSTMAVVRRVYCKSSGAADAFSIGHPHRSMVPVLDDASGPLNARTFSSNESWNAGSANPWMAPCGPMLTWTCRPSEVVNVCPAAVWIKSHGEWDDWLAYTADPGNALGETGERTRQTQAVTPSIGLHFAL